LLPDVIPIPSLSPDPNLTALVQLGALRVDCDRSFLSLIDGNTQYIVAEATRSTSYEEKSTETNSDDNLYLGALLLDKAWGVCPNTMNVFTDEKGDLKINNSNVVADRTRYIIRDFQADDHYKERPYVKDWPHMRSYAEVPIISPLGYVIGGYCVVDNRLRDFGDETIHVLSDIGKTIMSHLENVRIKHRQARSEKLIHGLDTFIQEEARFKISKVAAESQNGASSIPSLTSNSLETSGSPLSLEQQRDVGPYEKLGNEQGHTVIPSLNGHTFSTEIQRVFTRSAQLICESLCMDGLVFLDACPLGFGNRRYPSHLDLGYSPEEADDVDETYNMLESSEICPILALSIGETVDSTINADSLRIPESDLNRLIKNFPQGQLFSVDDYGVLEAQSTVSHIRLGRSRPNFVTRSSQRTQTTIDKLFQYFPQARSAIFLPLWHFQKERWFAAAIGWTCDPTHSFTQSDATYLSAFGNTIMAEILRYEALAVSRAKSDFISSISHEIRSPLHGIMATTELLTEATKSNEALSMLDMIQSCATTLLDTMNHLLDFAKINNLEASSNGNRSSKSQTTYQIVNLSQDMTLADLGQLIEEVTDNVVAGHNFETNGFKQSINGPNITLTSSSPLGSKPELGLPVLVTLRIQHSRDWKVPLNVGAWKRIVMNLVGNSLKYTPRGRIDVELNRQVESGQESMIFSVKDTGIGISDQYLKYQLFTPFAQENTFASGTGLGLCIVQQIVQNIGGMLELRSEVGTGTHVSVSVPVKEPLSSVPAATNDQFKIFKGMKLCYVNPGFELIEEHDSTGTNDDYQTYKRALRSLIIEIASDYFGMEIVSNNTDRVPVDIYIIDLSLRSNHEDSSIIAALSLSPAIVIGRSDSKSLTQSSTLSSLQPP
jgi:signal transduction histidine kinase